MRKIVRFAAIAALVASMASCRVEFSPNAEWRDVPIVYCVLDPEEDTVWCRVQRCYLGEDNLYSYASCADSTNYPAGSVSVKMIAWKGDTVLGSRDVVLPSQRQMVREYSFQYTERPRRTDGSFSAGSQPLFYCPVGDQLLKDSLCVYELLVIRNSDHDTIARATTTLVGKLPLTRTSPVYPFDPKEVIVTSPNNSPAKEFCFASGVRGRIEWNTLPRGRRYQPTVIFRYSKWASSGEGKDTFGIEVPGNVVVNSNSARSLSTTISKDRFFSIIYERLCDNTDPLFMVNNVDIRLDVCNEDLNAYINSQNSASVSADQDNVYTNIQGGFGVFGSRRTHIIVNVPSDSAGNDGHIPLDLVALGVGFVG